MGKRGNMSAQEVQKIHQLKNLINFSVEEFAVHKPSLDALWLNKGDQDKISMLLNTEHGILVGESIPPEDFSAYDLIDALKQFMRTSAVFTEYNVYIENFVESIQAIELSNTPDSPQQFQESMETLILALAKDDDIEKAYCIFQFLYLVRHIFKPSVTDDFFKCALVIGPIFQEAFGKQDDAQLVPIFYHTFAYVMANPKYDQTYHMTFSQITRQLENLEQTEQLTGDNQMSEPEKMQPEPILQEVQEQPKQSKKTTEKSDLKPKNNEDFTLKKEDMEKAKELTIKLSKCLWYYSKVIARNTWLAIKFIWKHTKIYFNMFIGSNFYAKTKSKILSSKNKIQSDIKTKLKKEEPAKDSAEK